MSKERQARQGIAVEVSHAGVVGVPAEAIQGPAKVHDADIAPHHLGNIQASLALRVGHELETAGHPVGDEHGTLPGKHVADGRQTLDCSVLLLATLGDEVTDDPIDAWS